MLAFATAFLGGGLLMTVFREEFAAANSKCLFMVSGWKWWDGNTPDYSNVEPCLRPI